MTRRRSFTLLRPMPSENAVSRRSSVMPSPSSITSMTAPPPLRSARIVIVPPPTLRDSPCFTQFSTSGWRIMLGTRTSSVFGLDVRPHPKLRAESNDFDVEVLVDRLELFADRDEVIGIAEPAPQQRRQPVHDHARRFGLRADQRRDRGQRVEQEVRVDLRRRAPRSSPPAATSPVPAVDARCVRCSRS